MTHSFNTEVAKKVGVNAAILYQNIQSRCAKNKANDKHFYDGAYWTCNSIKAFVELFDYLGESQIKSALKKLEIEGYLSTGNYNKVRYDRTKWFSDNHLINLSI